MNPLPVQRSVRKLHWLVIAVIAFGLAACGRTDTPDTSPSSSQADAQLRDEVAKLKADSDASAKAEADAKQQRDIEEKVRAEFEKQQAEDTQAQADADAKAAGGAHKSTGGARCKGCRRS